MAARYLTWNIPQLKQELVARGAATRGRKTDLVERLESYDRNANFKANPILLPDPLDVEWPSSGFQQVNPDHLKMLPKVTREQTEAYFLYRLAGDKESSSDIKAITKGELLFESQRIMACSVLIKDDVFFTGIVGAAMKNKVTYNYKLKLDAETGDVLSSHCECPAGKGPHGTCKHLAAVLIMLEHFTEHGSLSVSKSCTESLMMFNKPKKAHDGHPIKVEDLPTKKKKVQYILDDPRPQKYKQVPGFQDWVRNMLINYTARTSADIAYRYLHEKADLQTAVKDHDYLSVPFTEYFVDEAVQVNDEEIEIIEETTRGQASNKKWFSARSWRLTASNFGQITHMTDRRNKLKLCNSLLSNNTFTSPSLLHGKNYEKRAIIKFEKNCNVKVKKCGLFILKEKPFLGATPDGVIDELHIVEVKCPYSARKVEIQPNTLSKFNFLTIVDGAIELKKTSHYYDQIQGQLLITKRQFCYFVVYTFKFLFVQKIEINKEYCNTCLLPKLEYFYSKYFKPFIASHL